MHIIDRLKMLFGFDDGEYRVTSHIGEALATERSLKNALKIATRMASVSGERVVVHDVRTGKGIDVRPERA